MLIFSEFKKNMTNLFILICFKYTKKYYSIVKQRPTN